MMRARRSGRAPRKYGTSRHMRKMVRSTPRDSQRRPGGRTAARRHAGSPALRLAERDVLHQLDLREAGKRVAPHEDRLVAGRDAGEARAQVHGAGHDFQQRMAPSISTSNLPQTKEPAGVSTSSSGALRQSSVGVKEQQGSARAAASPGVHLHSAPARSAEHPVAQPARRRPCPSLLPPSTTITSWPRARSGAALERGADAGRLVQRGDDDRESLSVQS